MKLLSPTGIILILLVVLILFGPKRLPDLGRSFRKSMKAFSEEMSESPSAGSDAPSKPSSKADETAGSETGGSSDHPAG